MDGTFNLTERERSFLEKFWTTGFAENIFQKLMNKFLHLYIVLIGRTLTVVKDAEWLLQMCNGSFDDTSEYQLLIRLLNEQTIFDDDCRRLCKKTEIKAPSKVLLNLPSPEVTFQLKAGEKHFSYVETAGKTTA